MAYISKYVDLDGSQYDIKSKKTAGIPYAQVDSTSTSTKFTATVPEITELYDGVCVYLKNGVVTSASGFTININGLGALPVYSTLAAASRSTTIFNINYTMLFIYNSSRVEGGCWDCFYGYDSNTNTIGYQIRTNSSTRPMAQTTYRYRILFSSPDDTKWVPSNTSTATNATTARTVNQAKINPFGEIVYYGTTAAVAANANPGSGYLYQQYAMVFGYAFNTAGGDLTLTYPAPVYIKCAPQTDGSAIIDDTTPYVQSLPSSEDGKIYIYIGRAYDATHVEVVLYHPVYYYKDGQIRLYTNPAATSITVDSVLSSTSENPVQNKVITNALSTKQDILTFDYVPTYGSTNPVESQGIYTAIDTASKEAGIIIDAGYITDYGLSGDDLILGENILFNGQNSSLYSAINSEYAAGHTNIVIRLKQDGPEAVTSSLLPSTIDRNDDDYMYKEASDYLMHFEYVDTYGFYFSVLLGGDNSVSKSDTGNLYAILSVSSSRIVLTYKLLPLDIAQRSFHYNSSTEKYELTTNLKDFIWSVLTYGPIRFNLIDMTTSGQPRYYRIVKANTSAGYFTAENIDNGVLRQFTLQITNPDFDQNQYLISVTEKTLAGTSDVPTATSQLINDSGFITDAGVTSFNGSTGAVTYTAPVTSVNGQTGAVTGLQESFIINATEDSNNLGMYIFDKTWSDIISAIASGQSVFVKTMDTTLPYSTWVTVGIVTYAIFGSGILRGSEYRESCIAATNVNGTVVGAFIQDGIDFSSMQTTTNLVTSVSSSSTDAQYPSAKLFYDTVGDIETLLAAI